MDLLKECALSFQKLLEYEYHFVIGRKGQLREFRLGFERADFHHLVGLHKLKDNQMIFRYNEKIHKFSVIKADYLLEGNANRIPSYLFLGARNEDEKEQMCRTFFRIEDKDYTEGQPKYTLLRKEKVHLPTGNVVIQYDKLFSKEE